MLIPKSLSSSRLLNIGRHFLNCIYVSCLLSLSPLLTHASASWVWSKVVGKVGDEWMEKVIFEWKNLASLYYPLPFCFPSWVLSLISNGFFMRRTLILQMYIINRRIFKKAFIVFLSHKNLFFIYSCPTHNQWSRQCKNVFKKLSQDIIRWGRLSLAYI